MTERPAVTLNALKDTGLTVADPRDDVRGRMVRDASGDELGTVDDLVVDASDDDARVRLLLVKHGGLLGLGAEVTYVPVEAVTGVDDDEVRIDQSRDRVADAPRYDPELASDDQFYGSVYGYYGYAPFWAPGYVPGVVPGYAPAVGPRHPGVP